MDTEQHHTMRRIPMPDAWSRILDDTRADIRRRRLSEEERNDRLGQLDRLEAFTNDDSTFTWIADSETGEAMSVSQEVSYSDGWWTPGVVSYFIGPTPLRIKRLDSVTGLPEPL